MSSEKKILTMAELLRAAKLKKEKEESDSEESAIVSATIPSPTIVNKAVPRRTRVSRTIVPDDIPKHIRVEAGKGYFQFFNDLSDRIIPELRLDPFTQSILQRLIRLSHGWKSLECEVGLGALAKSCVMSKTTVQKSVALLVEKGLIIDLGETKKGSKDGKRYRVLPGLAISRDTIVRDTIVDNGEGIVGETTQVRGGIVRDTTNKDSNKDLKNNKHTQVGVGSKFTIEECRRYAEHLRSTGQGINNPGGYATMVHRTGEADVLIESFLHPVTSDPAPSLDISQCPDCKGTGFYYPKGIEGGVARCKHQRLKE
jgi:hypothetical protein